MIRQLEGKRNQLLGKPCYIRAFQFRMQFRKTFYYRRKRIKRRAFVEKNSNANYFAIVYPILESFEYFSTGFRLVPKSYTIRHTVRLN